jgi:hypothetical protein
MRSFRLKNICFVVFLLIGLIFYFGDLKIVNAAQPVGFLDRADSGIIFGWTKDVDFSGSIYVYIYVDGVFAKGFLANEYRSDVGGNYGFSWRFPNFGYGNHEIKVFALGVNSSGNLDNENIEITGSPKNYTELMEYELNSSNGQVKVTVDSRYGGSISKIIDSVNFPNQNLVADINGGSLLQSAFWLQPSHPLPEGCTVPRSDLYNRNPTQGGYHIDAEGTTKIGNPIGLLGTDVNPKTFDLNEFIRFENNNQTVHYKTKLIRYDYCFNLYAKMQNRDLWDTDFYLEGFVSFDSKYPKSLKIQQILTYVGGENEIMMGRQFPILFSYFLPRLAYWKNGQKIVKMVSGEDIVPDKNWVSHIGVLNEAGIGMVVSPRTSSLSSQIFRSGCLGCDPNGSNAQVFIPYPALNLSSFGTVTNMNLLSQNEWQIMPGASLSWTVYLPIGTLMEIKQQAETILVSEDFGQMPDLSILILKLGQDVLPQTFEDLDGSLQVNSLDLAILFSK